MIASPAPETSAPRAARCWTLQGADAALDVEVVARDTDTLEDVLPALARVLGSARIPDLWSGSSRLSPSALLSAPGLAHGAILGVDRPGPRALTGAPSALELHITGGPEAGRTIALHQGRHVIGRGAGADIDLCDPDVSRRHAVVDVGGGEITVADLGSTNGTRLEDAEVPDSSRPWRPGAALRLGATTATVTGPQGAQASLEPGVGGRTLVLPSPRLSLPHHEAEVSFPRAPDAPLRRRLPWVATALPAAAGVVMAVLLRTPTFLFFAVLGPVMAVGSWLSDRWSGRRTGRREAAAHALALASARHRLADAVDAEVRALDAAHPDLATLSSAARRRAAPLWTRRRSDEDALTIRLGTGPAPTRVSRVDSHGSRRREPHEHVPAVLDLRASGGLGVVGPRSCALSVVRAVVAQLAALHPPGEVDLLLLADDDRIADWRWARWLPHLDTRGAAVAGRADGWVDGLLAARRGTGPGDGGWLVVIADGSLEPALAARLHSARDYGVLLLAVATVSEALPAGIGAVLTTSGEVGETVMLTVDGSPTRSAIVADLLRVETAAALARELASLEPVRTTGRLPRHVSVLDVPGPGLVWDGMSGLGGAWTRSRASLVSALGWTESGPLRVDLCRAGPHALVAGTTGAGKSQLLQTLIATLALAHPPDRCSFLLVDYKGGAAFAQAADLPHTVGVLTDLDGQSTARALRSLTAELTRREAVLAEHRVADIADLPDSVDLARLVIVVDEFATLADELPGFVPGLVAIAQRGRSLGVHLVLATQRPSGVVSPEIRANCTLRICLRTTDEGDSRDVLGVPDAAHLPIDVPGRAFARTGSGVPVPFQVAQVSTSETTREEPWVGPWRWPPLPALPDATPGDTGRADLARLVATVRRRADEQDTGLPHRPWLPPLPDRIALEDLALAADKKVRLGLIDRPDVQAQEILELDLDDGGAWLVIGGPGSGRTSLLRTVLAGAISAWSPADLHVHVLDHRGGALAREVGDLAHAGTFLDGNESLRTVRLLERLTDEVAARRSGAIAGPHPRLLLLVDGAESVMDQLDECDPTRGSAALLRLVRDGAAVGLTCVLTADRAIPGSRLAAVAAERLVLPLADRADYAVAGVPAAAVPAHKPPGRALLGDGALECQLAVPTQPLMGMARGAASPRAGTPLRIVALPPDPVLADGIERPIGSASAADPSAADLLVAIGPGGDEGHPLSVDLSRTGGLLVVGPPGSGRTAAIDAITLDLIRLQAPILRLGHEPPRSVSLGQEAEEVRWARPWDTEAVADWLAGPAESGGVVVADDVGAAADWPVLTQLVTSGRGRPPVLVATGTAGDLTGHYQGTVAALRRSRHGLLLCPGPAEADVLGLRLPRTPVPARPGSGWLVRGGRLDRVQVARRRSSRVRP